MKIETLRSLPLGMRSECEEGCFFLVWFGNIRQIILVFSSVKSELSFLGLNAIHLRHSLVARNSIS